MILLRAIEGVFTGTAVVVNDNPFNRLAIKGFPIDIVVNDNPVNAVDKIFGGGSHYPAVRLSAEHHISSMGSLWIQI
ncbi:hypothetical protein [Chitinophaga sp. OAE865]|uniref:hypothetical protein n=1 Tax=Chitinophaga sp. OAE865 TaxID=2817898 RepID=UPI001AEAECB4